MSPLPAWPVTYLRVLVTAPAILLRAAHRSRKARVAFGEAVEPVLTAVIADPSRHECIRQTLRPWAAKGGHIIAGYATMAGVEYPAGLSAVGACFARVYDDLLDDAARSGFAVRAAAMFAGECFEPADELERLLHALYRRIHDGLRRDRANRDPIYAALRRLHEYQTESCAQRGGALDASRMWTVTLAKGGLSLLVLCALARPGMDTAEQRAIVGLGGVLQLVDDYLDERADRAAGIVTPATTGQLCFSGLYRRLAAIEPVFRLQYGRAARSFLDEIYFFLALSLLSRRLPATRRPHRPPVRYRGALRELLARGGNVARC